eukprot:158382-Chlamydomonas_euryale.AAC.1
MSQSQSYRERILEGYACVERSKTEGIKQQAGRVHEGNATWHAASVPPRRHRLDLIDRDLIGLSSPWCLPTSITASPLPGMPAVHGRSGI